MTRDATRQMTRSRRAPTSGYLHDALMAYLWDEPQVFHLGTMRKADREPDSLELTALSVSCFPDEWRQIARLGGAPLWVLERPGGTFIDVVAALRDRPLVDRLMTWAKRAGYVQWRQGWELATHNDNGHLSWLWFDTEEEARRDREDWGDTRARIRSAQTWRTTPKAAKRAAHTNDDEYGEDVALFFYCEDRVPEVDGLWWNEELDVDCYSAPRGGIFERSLPSWARRKLTEDQYYRLLEDEGGEGEI